MRVRAYPHILIIGLILLLGASGLAAGMLPARIATAASHLPEGFEEVQVAEGIIAPVAMEFSPDGRLFVSQQSGQLRVIKDGALLVDPFLTVSVLSGFQRGLQGLAFDPSFEANGYVYVYYTSADTGRNRLSRFTASQSYPDVADPNSELVILDIGLPAPGNYNGGSIYFGTDGNLFVSVGDHDTHANSQSLANLAGKLLRIDPTSYPDIIPPDNPFVETPDDPATRGEIWAYGLRNPFKIAVDPVSGSVYINDVGENDWEEINLGLKGANYGWSICEGPFQTNDPYGTGTCTDNSFEEPIYAYHHSFGSPTGCAITGGTFNRVTQFPAEYAGDYFFSDYCGGWIYRLTPAGQVIAFATATEGFVVDLRFGLDGNLYYLDRTNRTVRRIQHAGAGNQSPIAAAAADPVLGFPPLTVNFDATGSSDPDNDPLTYTWDFGDGTAIETGVTVSHIYTSEGPYVAVLSVEDGKGGVDTVTVSIMVGNPPVASMNLPLGGANFDPGDTINYEGTATDAEDGDLPSDSFAWLIVLHHHWEGDPNHHIHPFLGPYEGGKNGTFTIPAGVHEGAVDIWYRIHLVVADSSNLTDEVTRDIFPNWEGFINAGGAAYSMSTGEAFLADRTFAAGSFGFVGGSDRTFGVAIEGTTDDLLFQTMRVGLGGPFSYVFDNLAPDDYQITLYFADPRSNSVGDRVFDVSVEGTVVLAGYDIVAAAGGYQVAHTETITVPLADGQLNVDFSGVIGIPVVSAVTVATVSPPEPGPSIGVSPTSLDFGQVVLNGTSDLTVTLTNSGSEVLTVSGLSSTNAVFTVVAPTAPVDIAANGGTQVVTVRFSPIALGNQVGNLEIVSNDPGGGLELVSLGGSGVAGGPYISVFPTSLDFGEVVENTTSDLTVTLTNSGSQVLTVSGLSTTNAVFTVVAPTAPVDIAANGGTQDVSVRFSPIALGNQVGNLEIVSNNPGGGLELVSLGGSGVAGGPYISVFPTSLDFGEVVENTTSDLTVTLTNSGGQVLTVTGVATTNAVFTVVAPTAPVDIAANGGTQEVTVRFSPIAFGNQVGNLEIVSNDPGGGLELVSLGGSGVAGGPYIIVFPTSLDFGEVVLNGTSDLTVTLTNSGGQVLTVTGVATTNAVFTVVAPTAPVDIGANGGTQVVTVRFSPIAFGTQVGNLEIVINDPDEGVMILALAGTGVERRINAGGEAYNTATGEAFLADRAYAGGSFGFVGGRDRTYGVAIEGTTDDLLFQTMRVGNRPFSYIFDNLAPGDYQITLYFAEPRANSVGDRVFDVSVEGGVVLAGYDIVAAAGGYRVAHSETITVPVADGQLNVDFSRVTGFPVVSAVAVAAAGAG